MDLVLLEERNTGEAVRSNKAMPLDQTPLHVLGFQNFCSNQLLKYVPTD